MRFPLILLFLLSINFLVAQETSAVIEKVIGITPRSIPKYVVKKRNNVYFLQTAFNNAVYEDVQALNALSGKVILKVELIYTTYRKSETFDQHGLNRKRLQALFKAAPNILSQPGIEWVLIAQTACTSAEMGKEFFHGVVITTRNAPSAELVEVETDFLRGIADGTLTPDAYDAYLSTELKKDTASGLPKKEPQVTLPNFPGGERSRIDYFTRNLQFPTGVAHGPTEDVTVQFIVDKNGDVQQVTLPGVTSPSPYHQEVFRFVSNMPKWAPGKVDGKPIDCMVTFTAAFHERGSVIAGPLEVYAADAVPPAAAIDYSKIPPTPQGRIVSETLEKNNWKQAALVCDVTGSMAPYNAQVLLWVKNRLAKKDTSVARIVLFNDGDGKKNMSKRTGSTGGLYSFKPTTIAAFTDQMTTAMKAGDGGDLPENNVEALLKAQTDCPTCENLVMIADNFATPRDLSLAGAITKPVQIIVCGNSPVLNDVWLNLARLTKGSVTFANRLYANLHTYEEGATLQVGKQIFVVRKGKFTLK